MTVQQYQGGRFGQSYGDQWELTKRRWRDHPFTRHRRCFWCRRKRSLWVSGHRIVLDAHHLVYPRNRPAGEISIWLLRPMCRTCHKVETWMARGHRAHMRNGRKRYAHLLVTYLGRWAILWAALAPIVYLYLTALR